MSEYGLLSRSSITKQVMESAVQRAMREGERVTLRKMAHYDEKAQLSYIYLGGSRVALVTPDEIEEVPNGTDGVLFVEPSRQEFGKDILKKVPEWQYGLRCDDSPLSNLFRGNYARDNNPLGAGGCRQMVVSSLLSMMFPNLVQRRPHLIFLGEQGSGKTYIPERAGYLLYGAKWKAMGVADNVCDVETQILGSFFVVFDNLDDTSLKPQILDLFCRFATGGNVARRSLYTTASLYEKDLDGCLWATSRTNPLNRPDVASRQILIPMGRPLKTQPSAGETAKQVEDLRNRDMHMAEVIGRVQKMLRSLAKMKDRQYTTDFRVRDFSVFCLKIAEDEGWSTEMEQYLNACVGLQADTAKEGTPLLTLLMLLMSKRAKEIQEGEVRLNAMALRKELDILAERMRMTLVYKTPESLGHAIKRELTMYEKAGVRRVRNPGTHNFEYILGPDKEMLHRAILEWQGAAGSDPWGIDDMPNTTAPTPTVN